MDPLCLRETKSSALYFGEISEEKAARPPPLLRTKFNELESAIITYLDEEGKRSRLHDLLIESGVFDLMNNGMTRLLIEKVPEKQHVEFLTDYLLIKNWTKEEMDELEEESVELKTDLQALREENEKMRTELREMGFSSFVPTPKSRPLISSHLVMPETSDQTPTETTNSANGANTPSS